MVCLPFDIVFEVESCWYNCRSVLPVKVKLDYFTFKRNHIDIAIDYNIGLKKLIYDFDTNNYETNIKILVRNIVGRLAILLL